MNNRSTCRRLIFTAILFSNGIMSGCSLMPHFTIWGGTPDKSKKTLTIADLKQAKSNTTDTQLDKVQLDIDEVINAYREAAKLIKNPDIKTKLQYRLANLQMQKSQQAILKDTASTNNQPFTQQAINGYDALLLAHPNNPNNDQILYQQAKAYDFNGEQEKSLAIMDKLVKEYPLSNYYTETQFRRGEIYFSYGEYDSAANAFSEAMKGAQDSRFYNAATSMHGWSLFKLGKFQPALKSYISALDNLMPNGMAIGQLSNTRRSTVDDLLRVMSFAFSYLKGIDSLSGLFDEVGHRNYEYLVYEQFGKQLFKQERYFESIEAYRRFIKRYPLNAHAPQFQQRVIGLLPNAQLTELVLPEKTRFIERYGINSPFWKKFNSTPDIIFSKKYLNIYLQELASYHHSIAQRRKNKIKALADYHKASRFYQTYIETFPTEPKTVQMRFLLGETLFSSQRYKEAIQSYNAVAYPSTQPDTPFDKRAEAGYAAIMAYDAQLKKVSTNQADHWKALRLSSLLQFSKIYKDDSRAPSVLQRAIELLYRHKDYALAINEANHLLNWTPKPSKKMQLDAWLIMANSHFELKGYAKAETALTAVISGLSKKDKRYHEATELLAASIYRQGERLANEGKIKAAIAQMLRVRQAVPHSKFAINAEFDAASYLMKTQQWPQAISVLKRFRRDHPQNKLSTGIPLKLTFAYQQNKQWQQAAKELIWVSTHHKDPEKRRLALHQAASFYEKEKNDTAAIPLYRRYAHQYAQPLDLLIETQFKLSELYLKTHAPLKRGFWLNKVISTFDSNVKKGNTNNRMRYLAASASNINANSHYVAFNRIKLVIPLKKSLKKKKKALKRALSSFEKTASYGVQEYTTSATFHIAQIYNQLSQSLYDSERPKRLSELELEQYDILLEEQAFPFEEKAIQIHEINTRRSWKGAYDEWIKNSFSALKKLLPARYKKDELKVNYSEHIL